MYYFLLFPIENGDIPASYVGVSKTNGTPKSWILIGFGTIIFTIHFGVPLFLETPMLFYQRISSPLTSTKIPSLGSELSCATTAVNRDSSWQIHRNPWKKPWRGSNLNPFPSCFRDHNHQIWIKVFTTEVLIDSWFMASNLSGNFPLLMLTLYSGQIILFHQPRFPWNKVISLTKPPLGVRSCEVAIIDQFIDFHRGGWKSAPPDFLSSHPRGWLAGPEQLISDIAATTGLRHQKLITGMSLDFYSVKTVSLYIFIVFVTGTCLWYELILFFSSGARPRRFLPLTDDPKILVNFIWIPFERISARHGVLEVNLTVLHIHPSSLIRLQFLELRSHMGGQDLGKRWVW